MVAEHRRVGKEKINDGDRRWMRREKAETAENKSTFFFNLPVVKDGLESNGHQKT